MSDNTAENLPPEETEAPVVADIQPEVPSLEEENKKLRDQLLRAIAETDNVRKRADRDREGVFEYADRGTLFLDEIGDMPMSMQPKLLRVLETGDVVRLGSNEQRRTDVRFV
ncbi:MAG: nucleotide exchange factor GrpE, partial [Alphaproteobacteria bacterium]|nr:nucleotide exchange factor GrpE [Alphaproteobacteria bacterium]